MYEQVLNGSDRHARVGLAMLITNVKCRQMAAAKSSASSVRRRDGVLRIILELRAFPRKMPTPPRQFAADAHDIILLKRENARPRRAVDTPPPARQVPSWRNARK